MANREVRYFALDARDPLGSPAILCQSYDIAKSIVRGKPGWAIGWFYAAALKQPKRFGIWARIKEIFNG